MKSKTFLSFNPKETIHIFPTEEEWLHDYNGPGCPCGTTIQVNSKGGLDVTHKKGVLHGKPTRYNIHYT